MASVKIEPFSDAHLDDAAQLLAARHARHREVEPLLPDDVDFRHAVEREWSDGATGVFARDGARPVGYLFARPTPFATLGKWMLAGIAGHALDGDAELARDLYAAAGSRWVHDGHMRHGVFVPASDAQLVAAWFRLSFGAAAALAIRETAPDRFDSRARIRRGTPDDLADAARLERAMTESMIPAPSFSGLSSPDDEETRAEWRDTWTDERFEHFVAEHDGRVVGHTLLYRRPPDLRVPADSIDLAQVSTEPEARGLGVGRAMTAHVLTWAHDAGIPTMVTDWRMTNLLASRFWPKRGFRTTFLRLYRSIP